MLPSFLYPSYKQYKTDSDAVATWLATTARRFGYSEDLLTVQTSQQKASKLKGKAKSAARDAPRKQKSEDGGNSESKSNAPKRPRYIIAIDDFISLAEWIAKSKKATFEIPVDFVTVLNRAIAVRKRHSMWWNSATSQRNNMREKESTKRHSYFIGILEKVRELLKPMM